MSLRVYNTLTREKEPFETLVPGKVTMYLCGPTVYKPAHIGHLVGPVIFDTIKRYLVYRGYDVKFIVNITDIDDKLIHKATEKQTTVQALAAEMTEDYFDNLQLMNIETIDAFPKATEHIDEMLQMIGTLVEKGFAYPLDGDVYFRVTADDDYGKLSHRSVDQMLAGTRVEASDAKENPADFALWKASKPGEPAWDSPWGPGRPGWHIECSAMSCKHLGESIDIHGGGLDLMFPHHENELAQSESCTGKPFARYWLHNGLMQAGKGSGKVGGAHDRHGDTADSSDEQIANKLAGSAGAESVKTAVFAHHAPEVVRFFLLSTHYRSPIDFSIENIARTEKSMEGFYRLFETCERVTGQSFYDIEVPRDEFADQPASALLKELGELKQQFLDAMDDDFNTGGAIATLFDMRRVLNGFLHPLDTGDATKVTPENKQLALQALGQLKQLANLLGVFHHPQSQNNAASDELVNGLMNLIIEIRQQARSEKNWSVADKIRDALRELEITLEDGKEGVRWSRN